MGNFRSDSRGFDRGRSGGFGNRSGGFGGRSGGRGGFGGGRDRDSGGFGERRRPLEMHDVTCDKCGKQCQVPFRPTGDKPVFCSDCFRKEDSSSSFSPRSRDSVSSSSSSGISKEQFNELNSKLDKILEILELEIVEEDEDLDETLDEEETDIEAKDSAEAAKD